MTRKSCFGTMERNDVEGHTGSKPYTENSSYTNWELSVDRANATRRLIQENGVRPDQVTQVRGFADQELRKKDDPLDPSNRRVSMTVQYLTRKSEDEAPSASKEGATDSKPGEAKAGKAGH